MKKYSCSVCGYVYDEAKGIPQAGIAPGTKWEELPEDWTCPLCGAPKSEFFEKDEGRKDRQDAKRPDAIKALADVKELTPLEMSALCSNLARGCEKQYRSEEASLFTELAQYFKDKAAPSEGKGIEDLLGLIEKDLAEGFPSANTSAAEAHDRGALRALAWSEKVTRDLKSLLIRYQRDGNDMTESTGVYVCTICGFVYVGDSLPEICPVCKVPNWKFEKIEGRDW
ncbi:MAG: rubredoxin [Clostridiaceae bacterium]|nr:rubredoxin [Clostridiaceae bacterium]